MCEIFTFSKTKCIYDRIEIDAGVQCVGHNGKRESSAAESCTFKVPAVFQIDLTNGLALNILIAVDCRSAGNAKALRLP